MAVSTTTVGAGTLTIGATADLTNLSSQATNVRLVTESDQGDPINVLSGEQVSGDFSESQTLEGTLLLDLGNASSTALFLYDHAGETLPFEFVPNTAAGISFTGSLIVASPSEIGGDVKAKATYDFKFSVVGKAAHAPVA